MDILLTRPLEQSLSFARDIESIGNLRHLISPLIEIKPLGFDLGGVWDGFIVSSQNAVPALAKAPQNPVFCVGEQTAETVKATGFRVAGCWPTAEALIAALTEVLPYGRYAHLGGEVIRVDIARALTQTARQVMHIPVYAQPALALTPEARERLGQDIPMLVPLFSPRTAALFVQQGPYVAPLYVSVMSQAVRQELGDFNCRALNIAALPRKDEMIPVLKKHMKDLEHTKRRERADGR